MNAPTENATASMPPILSSLAKHPFLQNLKPQHLKALADCAMEARFNDGETIFREGDPANRFYLLKSGKITLETSTEEQKTVIQTLGPGEVLGWSWLFPPYYWHFDARAVEPTHAIFIYGTRLRELCDQDHELGYEIMKRIAAVVIKRLMAMGQQLAHHSL